MCDTPTTAVDPSDLHEENLIADLADDVHIATTHPDSGVCHGDNDGCQGGPDRPDLEAADRIYDRLVGLGLIAKESHDG